MEYLAVLLTAFLHASWNGLLKHSQNRTRSLIINRIVATLFGLVLILILPPIGSKIADIGLFLIAASCIHLIYFFSLLHAYKHGDFSHVYPIARGLSPLLILFVSYLLGADSLSLSETVGIAITCLGITFLSGRINTSNRKAIGFACITAFCIMGYTIASGYGVRAATSYSLSFLVYVAWLEFLSGSMFVTTALIVHRKTLRFQQLTLKLASIDIISGVMAVGGFSVALWAMTIIPIATVAALRETSVIFAVLIGWFLLNEPYGLRRLLASITVILGIIVLLFL